MATVRIVDNDERLSVGFEDGLVRVNESLDGPLRLCVSVSGVGEIDFAFSVSVLLDSENSTAGMSIEHTYIKCYTDPMGPALVRITEDKVADPKVSFIRRFHCI